MRWPPRRWRRRRIRASSGCSSARPTRTSRSACAARGSSSWIAASALIRDEAGIVEKFGVPPASIPDYLALVGDSADGYPGLAGWGAKSSAAVLAKYGHLESIPADWRDVERERGQPGERWRARSSAIAIWRSSSATWRRCGKTSRSSTRWTICAGAGRRRRSRRWRRGSTRPSREPDAPRRTLNPPASRAICATIVGYTHAESRNRRSAQRRQVHAVQRRHPHPQGRSGELSVLHHRSQRRHRHGAGRAARRAAAHRQDQRRHSRRRSSSSTSPAW